MSFSRQLAKSKDMATPDGRDGSDGSDVLASEPTHEHDDEAEEVYQLVRNVPVPTQQLAKRDDQDGAIVTRCNSVTQLDTTGSIFEGPTRWCGLETNYIGAKLAHGFGKLTLRDGRVYEGDWRHGLRHGRGRMTFEDSEYDGDWMEDQPSGEGKQTFTVGGYCSGQWVHGEMHGRGIKVEPDGSKFVGEFQNNQWHGAGKEYDQHGALIREGEWRDGNEYTPPPKPAARKSSYKFIDRVRPLQPPCG